MFGCTVLSDSCNYLIKSYHDIECAVCTFAVEAVCFRPRIGKTQTALQEYDSKLASAAALSEDLVFHI